MSVRDEVLGECTALHRRAPWGEVARSLAIGLLLIGGGVAFATWWTIGLLNNVPRDQGPYPWSASRPGWISAGAGIVLGDLAALFSVALGFVSLRWALRSRQRRSAPSLLVGEGGLGTPKPLMLWKDTAAIALEQRRRNRLLIWRFRPDNFPRPTTSVTELRRRAGLVVLASATGSHRGVEDRPFYVGLHGYGMPPAQVAHLIASRLGAYHADAAAQAAQADRDAPRTLPRRKTRKPDPVLGFEFRLRWSDLWWLFQTSRSGLLTTTMFLILGLMLLVAAAVPVNTYASADLAWGVAITVGGPLFANLVGVLATGKTSGLGQAMRLTLTVEGLAGWTVPWYRDTDWTRLRSARVEAGGLVLQFTRFEVNTWAIIPARAFTPESFARTVEFFRERGLFLDGDHRSLVGRIVARLRRLRRHAPRSGEHLTTLPRFREWSERVPPPQLSARIDSPTPPERSTEHEVAERAVKPRGPAAVDERGDPAAR